MDLPPCFYKHPSRRPGGPFFLGDSVEPRVFSLSCISTPILYFVLEQDLTTLLVLNLLILLPQ